MHIEFHDKNDTPARKAKIKEVLPKETFIASILEPSIEKHLFGVLAECIKKELEVYRAYPKNPNFGTNETTEQKIESFDPRSNETCFMGKGFRANASATDVELAKYRKAVGTINHPVWGDCTLMEIWGGDHFEEHTDMVKDAFKYGMGTIDVCPTIKVYVNPLFQNKHSKTFKISEAQQQYKDDMDMLLAKAIVWGVKEPKKRK